MKDDKAVQVGNIRWDDGEICGHAENPCAEDGVKEDLTARSKDKRGHNPNTSGEKPYNHGDIEHQVETIEDLPLHWGKHPIKPGPAQDICDVHSSAVTVECVQTIFQRRGQSELVGQCLALRCRDLRLVERVA